MQMTMMTLQYTLDVSIYEIEGGKFSLETWQNSNKLHQNIYIYFCALKIFVTYLELTHLTAVCTG